VNAFIEAEGKVSNIRIPKNNTTLYLDIVGLLIILLVTIHPTLFYTPQKISEFSKHASTMNCEHSHPIDI